jgi:hypothetical protein
MHVSRLAQLPTDAAAWLCWESATTGRSFEAFASHAALWSAVCATPEPRSAYEIIREQDPCKLYADIELYTPPDDGQMSVTHEDVEATLRGFLEAMRQAGGGGALTVLDGSRRVTLPPHKAEAFLGSATATTDVLKHSFHVIVQGHAFGSAALVRARLQTAVPAFATFATTPALRALAERQPGVVDMSVYYKNKNFRLLDCCKASAPDAPFRFHPRLNEHTDALDALVTYAAHLPRILVVATEPPIITRRQSNATTATTTSSNKRPRVVATPEARLERLLQTQRPRLDALQSAIRALMVRYGDTHTEVRFLHQLDADNPRVLRWECRNKGTRPCLLAQTEHRSNQVLLFLMPQSTLLLGDEVQDAYEVKYQCMSERCGRPAGIIGQLQWSEAEARYTATVEFPPRLCPASRRPSTFSARTLPLASAAFHPSNAPQPSAAAKGQATADADHQQADDDAADFGWDSSSLSSADAREGRGEPDEDDAVLEEPEEEPTPAPDPENPEQNTYELVKARFERRCFKVLSPFAYAHLVDDLTKEPDLYTPIQLQHLYANLYFFQRDPQTREWCKALFVKRWMGDVRIRQVKRIVVDPTHTNDTDNYNMWPGFAAERLPAVPERDVANLIEPVVRHIYDVYASEHAETTDFVLDLFANMVQRPHMPSHVALSIFGTQGCGKGMPLAFMREHVLGKPITYQTANPENDLLGRFQNGCVNRVLVQVDEVKTMRDHDDRLKDLITNDTVQLERKGRDIITVRNLVNLIFTSNNENALTVATDDRRFVLLRCTEKYRGNGAYLSALGQHLARPEVARAFYQFCLARDLSKYVYDLQLFRPVSAYYLECQRASIPVTSRFLSALLNTDCVPERMGALALFQQFVTFSNAGLHKIYLTETTFGRNIRRIEGVTKVRQARGVVYHFDKEAMLNHLKVKNEYDDDVSMV